LKENGLVLNSILLTHHHHDHVAGISALVKEYPKVKVFGSVYDAEMDRIPHQTEFLSGGDKFSLLGNDFSVLSSPGHTLGHICYLLIDKSSSQRHWFVGDTVFGAGCGRVFEGSYKQMYHSLEDLRKSLQADDLLWSAHEYTKSNLEIFLKLDKTNTKLSSEHKRLQRKLCTMPLLASHEMKINPFFNCDKEEYQNIFKTYGKSLETFIELRKFRDKF
jgi:hydroxyacylglutathione hydrolase